MFAECRFARRRAFTLIELLVVVAILALLVSILLPSLQSAREQGKTTRCLANEHAIGQGVHNSFTENRGYGPTWDDGEAGVGAGHQTFMLTWVDVLFDGGYVGDWKVQICPSDARSDEPMEARGKSWNFKFVETMGIGETARHGTRSSYAINAHMHYNFAQDKFSDAGRQLFAVDGWWTWFGAINAYWLAHQRIYGYAPDVMNAPHWEGAMVGWRHGKRFGCNVLFVDGHAGTLTPNLALTPQTIHNTVDTSRVFTWLPGERTNRFDFDPYNGEIVEWIGRKPYWTFGYGKKMTNGSVVPANFPELELHAAEKTNKRAWRRMPQRWQDRQ